MVSPIVLFVFVCAFISWIYKYMYSRPPNFPPGPPKLPIVGSYWHLLYENYNWLHKALENCREKYKSDLIGFHVGPIPTIVACDYKSIREILTRKEFDGRVDIYLARMRSFGQLHGIFFTDNAYWQEQRRFSQRYMRDFGFGRRSMPLEDVLETDISELINLLKYGPTTESDKTVMNGTLARMPDIFYAGFCNAILKVFTNDSYPKEKYSSLRDVSRKGLIFQRSADSMGGGVSLAPWLRHIFPKLVNYENIKYGHDSLLDFMMNIIQEHKATLNDDEDKGFLDIYLKEMYNQKSNPHSTFSDEQLLLVAIDYFFPTATATTVTLGLLWKYLLHFPEVQEKMYKEITDVVGHGRLPTLDDRQFMPYTEACIKEIMRIETLVPLGLPHRALEDTTLGGYSIPKNTILLTHLYHMHMDPEIWGDPQVFRPERFIDEATGLLKKNDISLPFGAGRRLCAGETFARQNMFLYVAGLIQNFTFTKADNEPLPPLKDNLPGLITSSREYWTKIIVRS